MDQNRDLLYLMNQLACPAFSVKNGRIALVNSDAEHILITSGTPILPMLLTGQAEYQQLQVGGCLSVLLDTEQSEVTAFVCRREEQDLFLLDQDYDEPALMALTLASSSLRVPLSNIINSVQNVRRHPENVDSYTESELNRIYKGAFQILRMVANMTDVLSYRQRRTAREAVNLEALFQETVDKAALLLEKKNIQVTFSCSVEDPMTIGNREQLERALNNLISNAAAKPSRTETPKIHVALTESEGRYYLTVTDNGQGIQDEIFGTIFARYRRNPSTTGVYTGIGLGLPIVRAVAIAHSGAVLLERLNPSGVKVTMTIKATPVSTKHLYSPRFSYDYTSEFDHSLVEFSPILPSEDYSHN